MVQSCNIVSRRFLACLNNVQEELLYYPRRQRWRPQMLKFYVKVFRTALFPNPMMDLVHVWYDNRYWSKILWGTIPTPVHDLKVKVTDLEFYIKSFALKFLEPQDFQTRLWISFMFGMMIDTGPIFYGVPSPVYTKKNN